MVKDRLDAVLCTHSYQGRPSAGAPLEVEAAGGLRPKGYIPVLAVGDQVLRESSDCVDRVAALSTEASTRFAQRNCQEGKGDRNANLSSGAVKDLRYNL